MIGLRNLAVKTSDKERSFMLKYGWTLVAIIIASTVFVVSATLLVMAIKQ